MKFKTVVMLGLYFLPIVLLSIGLFDQTWQLFACYVVSGFGMAGIGMGIMHDAIHGSFSSSSKLNKFFGASIYLLGGNVYNWDVQHNKLHHTYTNLHDIDEDIAKAKEAVVV